MKIEHNLISGMVFAGLFGALAASNSHATATRHLLDHDVRELNGEEMVNLREAYGGRLVLIVNTASKCAFTNQYEGLEALYNEFAGRGFVVLGFPSNDFGGQEPGSEQKIQDFCRLTYGVRFPMFAKSSVREGEATELYQGLASAAGRYPKWNFHKYLVGRDGHLVDDFASWTAPQSEAVREAIEAHL